MNGREPYLSAAQTLLDESGCIVRKWNTGNYGRAYTQDDDWGIDVPEPRGPISFSVFAHEVGHQLLHRFNSLPRWMEEIEAWEFAIGQFDRFNLPGGDMASAVAERCIAYATLKALRRTKTPEEMHARIMERLAGWPAAQEQIDPTPTPGNISYSEERRALDAA